MGKKEMEEKKIGSTIRQIRKSMKLTQSEFSVLTQLSEDSIGKIERGTTIPTIDTLYKIAEGLKVPFEKLISPHKNKTPQKTSRALEDFIAYLKTRSPEDIKFIHQLTIKILGRKK